MEIVQKRRRGGFCFFFAPEIRKAL